jgi:hypothetical protein
MAGALYESGRRRQRLGCGRTLQARRVPVPQRVNGRLPTIGCSAIFGGSIFRARAAFACRVRARWIPGATQGIGGRGPAGRANRSISRHEGASSASPAATANTGGARCSGRTSTRDGEPVSGGEPQSLGVIAGLGHDAVVLAARRQLDFSVSARDTRTVWRVGCRAGDFFRAEAEGRRIP